jgi:hypothetical protein
MAWKSVNESNKTTAAPQGKIKQRYDVTLAYCYRLNKNTTKSQENLNNRKVVLPVLETGVTQPAC